MFEETARVHDQGRISPSAPLTPTCPGCPPSESGATGPTAAAWGTPTSGAPTVAPRLDPHELGVRGETRARESLERRGWEVLLSNWHGPFGEVDIVARDPGLPDTVVLVEVKTRYVSGEEEVLPEEAVDEEKRRRYDRAAEFYLAQSEWASNARFDVVAISVRPSGMAHLSHRYGAFDGCS